MQDVRYNYEALTNPRACFFYAVMREIILWLWIVLVLLKGLHISGDFLHTIFPTHYFAAERHGRYHLNSFVQYSPDGQACLFVLNSPRKEFAAVHGDLLLDEDFPVWCSELKDDVRRIERATVVVHSISGVMYLDRDAFIAQPSDLFLPTTKNNNNDHLQIDNSSEESRQLFSYEDPYGEIVWVCRVDVLNVLSALCAPMLTGSRDSDGTTSSLYDTNPLPISISGPEAQSRSLSLSAGDIPLSEYTALKDLYEATNGPYWRWRSTGGLWNFTGPHAPCAEHWQGIICSCTMGNIGNNFEGNVYYVYDDYTGNDANSGVSCTVVKIGLVNFTLSGTLPASLSLLKNLTHLHLSANSLVGTLPNELGKLSKLQVLGLGHNQINGKIPPLLYTLSKLYFLHLGNNLLTGTLSSSIQSWSKMQYIYMANLHLSGTFPSEVSLLSRLIVLDVRNNFFSDKIPSSLHDMPFLAYIGFDNNRFSGTIPAGLGQLKHLFFLRLHANKLTGTIPAAIGAAPNLRILNVSYNQLTGTIPPDLGNLTFITRMFLQGNRFSGSIPNVFHGSTHPLLNLMEFSNNRLTGDLPISLFTSKTLRLFSCSVNCMTITSLDSLCWAPRLLVIALDGVNNAPACNKLSKLGQGKGYTLSRSISGSVPSCLFNMSELLVLHLAANNIQDSFPKDLNVSSALIDLVLSHNLLYGEIPASFQHKFWRRMDLAFNKFTGLIDSDFHSYGPDDFLRLGVNRLSGKIPPTLIDATNIYILEGNLFQCDYYKVGQGLPRNDEVASRYVCANALIQLSYVWAVPLGLALLFFFFFYISKYELFISDRFYFFHSLHVLYKSVLDRFHIFLEVSSKSHAGHLNEFMLFNATIRKSFVRLTMLAVVCFLPMYVVISLDFSTYQNDYLWNASSIYKAGVRPALIFFVMMVTFNALCNQYFHRDLQGFLQTMKRSWSMQREARRQRFHMVAMMIVLMINCMAVFFVHISYSYIVNRRSTVVIMISGITLALFKIVWQDLVLFKLIYLTKNFFHTVGNMTSEKVDFSLNHIDVLFFATMIILNNLLAPFFATLLTSKDCLNALTVPLRPIITNYGYIECPYFNNRAHELCRFAETVEVLTSFEPQFYYSYQCSAAFISEYSVVYIYMFLFLAIWLPAAKVILSYLCHSIPLFDNFWLYRIIKSSTPLVLKPVSIEVTKSKRLLFDKDRFVMRILNVLTIFATFGAAFPPLALISCATIFCLTYFAEYCVGRVLRLCQVATDPSDSSQPLLLYDLYYKKLEAECIGVAECFRGVWWVVSPFACFFHAFVLFDTMGDQIGWRIAVRLAFMLCAFPLVYRIVVGFFVAPLLVRFGYLCHLAPKPVSADKVYAESSERGTDDVVVGVDIDIESREKLPPVKEEEVGETAVATSGFVGDVVMGEGEDIYNEENCDDLTLAGLESLDIKTESIE